ncbi:Mu transposase C-terminal domain-containing protein [Alicyclobacillus mengziensis]|uniref:DDE-type integrase/transposase/recombinase n=1 Tax=Alicyclobacillus mengziensis TaxID=2931921 RepID=A0A9X7W162_9BACL|nr:Mu transposase C-terminal domain-containing protein [Alicyclobacillus mengziensis]QSO48419.1 DDE-type integrase/transposase/recombinase [Alicyclobacillus mengziensis]
MNVVVNQLFADEKGKLLRIVFVNKVTSMVYVIEVDKNQFPHPMSFQEFETLVETQGLQMVDEDNTVRMDSDDDLTDVQRMKRDIAWEAVQYFFQMVEGEEYAFARRYRQEAIKLAREKFNISYNTAKMYLTRYWSGGGVKNSVLPRLSNCGAPGRERRVSEKKRGRPRLRDGNQGVNVDDKMKKAIRAGLNKHYYSQRQNSLRVAYELTLRDYFSTQQVRDDGSTYPVLVQSIPSYAQFLYWARKWNDPKREIMTRHGMRFFQQKHRTIISNSKQDADLGCGELLQIDSTIFDIFLVSSLNRDVVVGRPRLLLAVDVFSSLILGVAVTFESLNAYSGAMLCLASAMSSKVDDCTRYGIEITDDDFPYCIPNRVLADRGELVNSHIENAIEQLGITVQQTPPYRADAKGTVEHLFHMMNLQIKPIADGVVVKGNRPKERGEIDYRLKANLTLEEFTTLVLKVIIFHNKHHVLEDYPLDASMIDEGIEKIPIRIWKHGLKHKKGQLRRLSTDTVRMALFPSGEATVGSRGISFKGLLYASQDTLRQGWFQRARTKGSWKIKVSYNPMDLTHIYVRDEGLGVHKLTLLDHLRQYSFKSEQEVEQIQALEHERTSQSKERELQEKIKLFAEIDSIVQDARTKTEAERGTTISKTKRLANIKENQKREKELEREKMRENPTVKNEPSIWTLHDDDGDELNLFRTVQEQNWGASDGE